MTGTRRERREHRTLRKVCKWCGAFVATMLAIVWIASGWVHIARAGDSGCNVWIMRGEVGVWVPNAQERPTSAYWEWGTTSRPKYNWELRWRKLPDGSWIDVCLAYPAMLALAVAIPLWRSDVIARRLEHADKCPTCGYDLAGLAPGASCPECGTAIQRAAGPSIAPP